MKTGLLVSTLILSCMLLNSCIFTDLASDIEEYDELISVSGKIIPTPKKDGPVVIVLWPVEDTETTSGNYWLMEKPGSFGFKIPEGKFHLIAYQDINHDATYQKNEPVGICVEPQVFSSKAGQSYTNIEITLGPYDESALPESLISSIGADNSKYYEERISFLGEVLALDDPIYSEENVNRGYWTPYSFYSDFGFKVSFLEEYDPERIPILFVHGAKGFPENFSAIIQNLDHDKFQAWVAYYPSGASLELLGKHLKQSLLELNLQYGFDEIILVAHSMGGLVTRRALIADESDEGKHSFNVPLFVSIATPWNGHASAKDGVTKAPAVVPSWFEMVPDNPFIKNLFSHPLPEKTRFIMFFSFDNDKLISFESDHTDGAVTLATQLHIPAQDDAERIIGIDSTHVGILSDPVTLEKLNLLLEGEALLLK